MNKQARISNNDIKSLSTLFKLYIAYQNAAKRRFKLAFIFVLFGVFIGAFDVLSGCILLSAGIAMALDLTLVKKHQDIFEKLVNSKKSTINDDLDSLQEAIANNSNSKLAEYSENPTWPYIRSASNSFRVQNEGSKITIH